MGKKKCIISALKRLKTVFFQFKSPPQAKKKEKSMCASDYTPLVVDNFETRGGIVARISSDFFKSVTLSENQPRPG